MSSRNKGRGGSSQPSNSGGKGPASKSYPSFDHNSVYQKQKYDSLTQITTVAPSTTASNGNATRGGKGANVNPTTPITQSAPVVSGNPSTSTNTQTTSSGSWSSLIKTSK